MSQKSWLKNAQKYWDLTPITSLSNWTKPQSLCFTKLSHLLSPHITHSRVRSFLQPHFGPQLCSEQPLSLREIPPPNWPKSQPGSNEGLSPPCRSPPYRWSTAKECIQHVLPWTSQSLVHTTELRTLEIKQNLRSRKIKLQKIPKKKIKRTKDPPCHSCCPELILTEILDRHACTTV